MFAGALQDFWILLAKRAPVIPEHQVGEFACQHLVLAHNHVEHSLCSHDLARWSYQWRISARLANIGHFFQHFLYAIASALTFQLAFHVADHAARNLALEYLGIDSEDVARELRILRPNLGEV